MATFTMVVQRRPVSANKPPNARYTRALQEAAQARDPHTLEGPLYARIIWFHKEPTNQDVDNIAKRILDSLKTLVFEDDNQVTHCLAARIDMTLDYELDGSPSSQTESALLHQFLADENSPHVLYVEVGQRTAIGISFGEVA